MIYTYHLSRFCHQHYQGHTRKPEIRHFADRTLSWNPGDAFATGDLLEPSPKEVRYPNIAIAFRRIGLSENAGWGLNDVIANWVKLGNARPIIHNEKAGKYFEIMLMADDASPQVTAQVTSQVVAYCHEPKSAKEIMAELGLNTGKHFKTTI